MRGIRTRNSVPRSAVEVTAIVPWCDRTISEATAVIVVTATVGQNRWIGAYVKPTEPVNWESSLKRTAFVKFW